jgi:hypothetical protein
MQLIGMMLAIVLAGRAAYFAPGVQVDEWTVQRLLDSLETALSAVEARFNEE